MPISPDLMEYIKRAALGTAPGAPPAPMAPAEEAVQMPFSSRGTKTGTKAHKEEDSGAKNSKTESLTEAAPEYRTAVGAYNQAAATQDLTPEKLAALSAETQGASDADRNMDRTRQVGLATSAIAKGATDGKLDFSNDWNQGFKSNAMDRLKEKRGLDEQAVKNWLKTKMDGAEMAKGLSSKTVSNTTGNESSSRNSMDTSTETSNETGTKSGFAPVADKTGSGGRANAAIQIPGHTWRQGYGTTPAGANKIKEGLAASKGIIQNTDTLMKTLDNTDWTRITPDEAQGTIKQLVGQIQDAKRVAEGWGAPQAAEFERMEARLGDPTKIGQFFKDEAGFKALRASYAELRRQTELMMANRADSQGLDKNPDDKFWQPSETTGTAFQTQSQAPKPPFEGAIRIKDKKTGRTGWAKPGAVPDGAEVIQ